MPLLLVLVERVRIVLTYSPAAPPLVVSTLDFKIFDDYLKGAAPGAALEVYKAKYQLAQLAFVPSFKLSNSVGKEVLAVSREMLERFNDTWDQVRQLIWHLVKTLGTDVVHTMTKTAPKLLSPRLSIMIGDKWEETEAYREVNFGKCVL